MDFICPLCKQRVSNASMANPKARAVFVLTYWVHIKCLDELVKRNGA